MEHVTRRTHSLMVKYLYLDLVDGEMDEEKWMKTSTQNDILKSYGLTDGQE